MRRFFFSLLVVAVIPAVAACGDPDKPPYAIANWQVSCENTGGCRAATHMIAALNGGDGNTIRCSLTPSGDRYLFDMSITNSGQGYAYRISNASIPQAGGVAASGIFEVDEQDNTFRGSLGGSPPVATCSDDPPTACPTPCQFSEIEFTSDTNGPAIQGKVACQGLPEDNDPTIAREVHFPSDRTNPSEFKFENCAGL